MTRDGALARQVVRLPVRLAGGDQVDLVASMRFNAHGAVAGMAVTLAPPPQSSELERQAALLVDAIDGKLRRRPDLGIRELRRRAEAALALLEQLEALEDAHGPEARALLAPSRGVAA